ncbi:MAG: MMPL family transporter [Chitinophagaceae bacterium]|nr:MMPL family transporter [Chitinophagaceae bacterium]
MKIIPNMWKIVSQYIIKWRVFLLSLIAIITVFFGIYAPHLQMSYDLYNIVPKDDADLLYFEGVKKKFGEDANTLVVGIKDSTVFQLRPFTYYKNLGETIQSMPGISKVISLGQLFYIKKNENTRSFENIPFFPSIPHSQSQLDSILQQVYSYKIYDGNVINRGNEAILMLISIEKKILDSSERDILIQSISEELKKFESQTGIQVHKAGIPYVRYIYSSQMSGELILFTCLSAFITIFVIFIFYRSVRYVMIPIILVAVILIWVMGMLVLFGFKITLLTGLIIPLVVVIGIPNVIYLTNKYHFEYALCGDKHVAISSMIQNIGVVIFMTNFTTAAGFLTLLTVDIDVLKEFGLIAGINIIAVFLLSAILIPIIFYYFPAPEGKELQHTQWNPLQKLILLITHLVQFHYKKIIILFFIACMIGFYGLSKLYPNAKLTDDIPQQSEVKDDISFLETYFKGTMPLELIIDTKVEKGALQLQNLEKIDAIEHSLKQHPFIASPLSFVSFVKTIRQGFYNGDTNFYSIPDSRDRVFIAKYLPRKNDNVPLLYSLVDSSYQKVRISLRIKDIGSQKLDSLIQFFIYPKITEVLGNSKIDAVITGTSVLFIKGNEFLIQNLFSSLLLAFGIITFLIIALFKSIKMTLISLIPNFIPLIMTAGIMGFSGITLKPSTIIIFSIAFGISVDNAIHFLIKYRNILKKEKHLDVKAIVTKTIQESVNSMIYTSIILFLGFIIFVFSSFQSTFYLGLLISSTLFISMLSNILFLPSIIIFSYSKKNKTLQKKY